MAFFSSAQELRLEDNHILHAKLRKVDGEWVDAHIDLNAWIGNDNGRFHWDGADFADSAENIRLSIEGDGPVAVLRADLRNIDGEMVGADLNLSERLGNNDGSFHWV
ncbi:Cyanovirin-N [Pseudomassariella vexata]|uniref:Cyanovirin-N n=1 Tax=Pseudomassariella vexata TaxID=1141098 RepID=A0A1Y2E2N9_9PEZI|nr:Cyanovirin-N [Pseudomassariella vexata]ORY65802.1 Cyanovirin-N [Pseudomassariella vexata]